MKRESCELIRDLLPLYEDGVASEEAQTMVREHLKDCPECREELRKMRTPVSLPPEQDKELLERYVQRREKLKGRRQIRIAAAVIIVLTVLSFLCYTIRSRSWADLTNGQQISSMSAYGLVYTYNIVHEQHQIGSDLWNLSAEQAEGDAAKLILSALEQASYRGKLRNIPNRLFPPSSYEVGRENSAGYIGLNLVNGQGFSLSLTVYSGGLVVFHEYGEKYVMQFYQTNPDVYQMLLAIVQEYGTLQK